MKIAVVGSREFTDKNFIKFIMRKYFSKDCVLISGGAKGVDSIAEEIIDKVNSFNSNPGTCIKKIIFKPDWDKYGKSAGFIRNKDIIDNADMVLAFWDGTSKGTKHSIDLAIKAGKPINIYIRK